jgi:hypothetical protein
MHCSAISRFQNHSRTELKQIVSVKLRNVETRRTARRASGDAAADGRRAKPERQ